MILVTCLIKKKAKTKKTTAQRQEDGTKNVEIKVPLNIFYDFLLNILP